MGTDFSRSIMFMRVLATFLSHNLKQWFKQAKNILSNTLLKECKLGACCGWRSAKSKFNRVNRCSKNDHLLGQTLYFTISQNPQPWKVGVIFSFYKRRNGDSERISYVYIIMQLLCAGARMWSHVCSKILLLKQTATNYLCNCCTQMCTINATSLVPSSLLACLVPFHSSLPRHICTSVFPS